MASLIRNIPPWELLHKSLPESILADFEFGLPLIIKGEQGKKKNRYIRGVASTPDRDLQDEYVIQKGLDLRYFLQHGYFNNDHKPGFENKVGKPTVAEIKKVTDKNKKSLLGLWVEGYLWPSGTHKVADAIWELANAIEAADADRSLGFSIQGKVLERSDKRIVRAWVQDIAITPAAVNTATWLEVVDGFAKGLWVTEAEVVDLVKSIDAKLLIGEPLINELWMTEKALSSSMAALAPESLEEKLKLNLTGAKSLTEELEDDDKGVDELGKALQFAYQEMKRSGYNEDVSRRSAFAAVARSLLS